MAELLQAVRAGLRAVAEPQRAPAMQAYMKSEMPYVGVRAGPSRLVFKQVFAELDLTPAERWRELVLELWRGAEFREERYAAIALCGDPRARPHQVPAALSLYEEMIVTGAWWDYVDSLASHRVGGLLRLHPSAIRPEMLAWSRDRDMWKRRSSIICQLRFNADTDLELLAACIQPSLASKEFFLRKAIGWALRQYAWVDPDWVVGYVDSHAAQLSPLSRREALKNVSPKRDS
jgi:3-methyladenine DNA glycosylase AlkD